MVASGSMASAKRRKRVKVLEQSVEGWRSGEKKVGSRERESKENSHVELLKMSQLCGVSGLV